MRDYSLYWQANVDDRNFPIQLFKQFSPGPEQLFPTHWHEQIEILYFVEGKAVIECSSVPFEVQEGEMVIINSSEIHSGYNPGSTLTYYCFNIDTSLLQSSSPDACEVKYISPIARNLIMFNNNIHHDDDVVDCIKCIIYEYEAKQTGYEMAIKSYIYKLLVLLLRRHVKNILTQEEYSSRIKNLERLSNVLGYIEHNYAEKITIEQLCKMSGLSTYYFCRLFKSVTGKTVSEYVNMFRINQAESLLRTTDMNVTEVALSTGFNDINYFSRLFRKYKKQAPSKMRK